MHAAVGAEEEAGLQLSQLIFAQVVASRRALATARHGYSDLRSLQKTHPRAVQFESLHQLPCFQRADNGPVATKRINEEMLPAATSDLRGAFRRRGEISAAKKAKCIPGTTVPPDVGPHDICLNIHFTQKL